MLLELATEAEDAINKAGSTSVMVSRPRPLSFLRPHLHYAADFSPTTSL